MLAQTYSKTTFLLVPLLASFLFTGCDDVYVDNQQSNGGNATLDSVYKYGTRSSNFTMKEVADSSVTVYVSEAQKQRFLDLVNAARAEVQDCGTRGVFGSAPALRWSNRLASAAYEHSNDMAQSNWFSHEGSGTASDVTSQTYHLGRRSEFYERIQAQGYTKYYKAGENLAAGYLTAHEAVDALLASDGHCANLMDPAYTEMGMAVVEKEGTEFGLYWSQEFASPADKTAIQE